MSAPAEPLDAALHQSRAHIPITVVSVVLSLASIAVGARCYARAVLIRQFGMDDWAALVALVLAMGSGIMVASNTLYGAGRHIAVVDPTLLWKYFRTFYISIVLYNGSLTAIKVTFLLQYYRVLSTPKMRRVIVAAFTFVSLWSVSQLLVTIFNCTPIDRFWLPELPGTCIPNLPFWYINAAGNILTDVIVFVVPLPALGSLNLRKAQKIMLLGIFSLGFFTCAISIIRIQYLRLSPDVTWDNVESSCWSISELCSGIICACLPTLRPILLKFSPGMMGSSAPSKDNYQKQSYGRDGSSGKGNLRSVETSSSRGIVYPEDIELHGGDSDEDRTNHDGSPRSERPGTSSYTPENLGLRPAVRTEIGVGSAHSMTSWGRSADRGIEVKRDFVVTNSKFS
ncbi:hypothetical protein QBC47DRAFT_341077 [Echria macrotheca]|uniref:Rhodopsin domain-containing protein n=1 Tax=Echria macrotheca TaxID=438768 RepID=A0AAJ0BGJ3_9PEZI|nr:hypothetical protein QBC47DRAFT_341077 [Echria macrotheca]